MLIEVVHFSHKHLMFRHVMNVCSSHPLQPPYRPSCHLVHLATFQFVHLVIMGEAFRHGILVCMGDFAMPYNSQSSSYVRNYMVPTLTRWLIHSVLTYSKHFFIFFPTDRARDLLQPPLPPPFPSLFTATRQPLVLLCPVQLYNLEYHAELFLLPHSFVIA